MKYPPISSAQKDSMVNQIKARLASERKQSAPPPTPTKIWDLFYGSFLPIGHDSIRFTTDSVSSDKRHKLTSKYKASGLQFVGAVTRDMIQSGDHPQSDIYKMLADTTGFYNKYMNDPSSGFNRQTDYAICLINTVSKDTVYLIALDSSDWVITSPQGYYTASKNAASLLHYTAGNTAISLGQFNLRNNRPDKIAEKIGLANKEVVEAYRNAYRKRISRLGIDTTAFYNNLSAPVLAILNRSQIGYEQTTEKLTLRIQTADSVSRLARFNVWVNDVPVFGMKGIDIRWRNAKKFDTTISIVLSQGENRIETAVLNANGIESFRVPLYIKYLPSEPKEETSYFIGIGIDHFADTTHNLQYCSKDIRDLALKLKEKYDNRLQIDTLFNGNVSIEKIKAIKQKLLQSKEDDKVIIAYSGHGLLSKDYDYYLSTYNVNFTEPGKNGLPYEEFEDLLDGIKARKKLMLIDACHSGELDKEEMQKIAGVQQELKKDNKDIAVNENKGIKLPAKNRLGTKSSFELMQQLFVNVSRSTGTTVISAAAGIQFALERGDLKNGVFTYSVMELLRPGKTVTVSQLKTYVGQRVSKLTKGLQQPTYRSETINYDWTVW